MITLELLSPAKTVDIGIEAIKHGADAVYIGAEEFGARAAATNTCEDIVRLTEFAHQYGAKVYVTVNTLIYDHELQQAEKLCWNLYNAGCDALIVQDLKLLSLNLPPIPLHASTQMDNRTAEKVRELSDLGFRQVVLARELTTDEISAIHRAVPDVSLEVFVHGALCVGLSGRCNASEWLFSRSANRGECAQVCRMELDLVDAESDEVLINKKHLLSLKDNCQLPYLEQLIHAGATSFKIEGRLKGVDYVKNITAAYSIALDRIIEKHPDQYRRASDGKVKYSFAPDIVKSFNRGFTTDTSKPEANIYTPKSLGEPLNEQSLLHNGDGICWIADGELKGMQLNNVSTWKPKKGITYYRNKDIEWDKLMARPTAERRIGVVIDAYESHVTMTDTNGNQVSCDWTTETAQTPQHENIRTNLGKLGDSIYEAQAVRFHFDDSLFIPAKQIAQCRRTLVGMMNEKRQKAYPREVQEHQPVSIATQRPYEETHDAQTPLMITKYCLRRQLGVCTKENTANQPLLAHKKWALRLTNGKKLFLQFDCKNCLMKVMRTIACLLPLFFLLVSCVGGSVRENATTNDTIVNIVDTTNVQPDSILMNMSPQQIDSLVFRLTHHYSINFNFVVKADSIMLIPREGDVGIDTCYVKEGELVAVAAISNHIDTIWVKVAHDQNTMGWIAESNLLKEATPDDPISEILYALSGSRGIWMSILAVIGLSVFFVKRGKTNRLRLVRIEQMKSPYPIMLWALIAFMAIIYASIQNFIPEYWQEYYFHPSLNPLMLPPIMALLVILVWLLIITFIAVCDEVYHKFDILDGSVYIFELLGVGMIVYLVVSWTTIIYIGYLLTPVFMHYMYTQFKRNLNQQEYEN